VHQKDQALMYFGCQEGSISQKMCFGAVLLLQLARMHLETLRPASKLSGKQDTLRVDQK
jgi:hypothetical protein